MELKDKYKHITGMRPQFTTFESEDERMASEITSKVIEKFNNTLFFLDIFFQPIQPRSRV